ncbi:MAG: hypothetical protein A2664_00985 [Candidatus Taylorbacteria bacterium RIFCSPHIGHO2_01_FULL_46_22b]|uniref:Uncharacterized protein n=1 Tax=Candidatus Taylorbacteria bacterium RIFCSPHIGHO2_01_FULL_46_22b TaxID=1802301 RepID=A0A1G2M2B5_9BACT|nr:MAG: hypothetical protein A2664_00985 [Candidatus Taylorbacteria bacterium RIFCSPHIGHO2_01_FULL_46_22b]
MDELPSTFPSHSRFKGLLTSLFVALVLVVIALIISFAIPADTPPPQKDSGLNPALQAQKVDIIERLRELPLQTISDSEKRAFSQELLEGQEEGMRFTAEEKREIYMRLYKQ